MSYVHIWLCNHMMNAAVTCERFCCPHLSVKLVLGIPTFSLNYNLYPSRHTLYQILAYFLWYLLPFHLAMLSKLLYTTRWCFILPFQIPSEMLYRINVWRLCLPLHHNIVMVIEPSWQVCWYAWGHCPAGKWYHLEFYHKTPEIVAVHPPGWSSKVVHPYFLQS